jgi:hypothetical protein
MEGHRLTDVRTECWATSPSSGIASADAGYQFGLNPLFTSSRDYPYDAGLPYRAADERPTYVYSDELTRFPVYVIITSEYLMTHVIICSGSIPAAVALTSDLLLFWLAPFASWAIGSVLENITNMEVVKMYIASGLIAIVAILSTTHGG